MRPSKTKDEVTPGTKPCRKWEFDKRLVETEPDEDTQVQAEKDTESQPQELPIQEPIADKKIKRARKQVRPVGETPAESFIRLSERRLEVIKETTRLLCNLGQRYTRKDGTVRYNYDWTAGQKRNIIATLQDCIHQVNKALTR